MRQEIINIYKFDELPEPAKVQAIEDFRREMPAAWTEENRATLEAFCNIFPVQVRDYSYSSCDGFAWADFIDDDHKNLTGLHLAKHIYNQYFDSITQGKYYSTGGKYIDGKYTYKCRHSKIIVDSSCPLTGYYMDDAILRPVFDFLKKPDNRTFEELIQDCLCAWSTACVQAMADQESDEYIIDAIQANEYEFLESGEML
ncbi:MAG: hypothetical protein ABFC57_06200 [Veillonellales bacterium]